MDRREFLTRSGIGVAAAASTGAASGAGVGLWEHHQERQRREAKDYAGEGRGGQRVWWSVDTAERVAALTFDDGPHHELTPRVLKMLARHDLRATFFMIGRHAADRRGLVREVMAAGHEIANHTWSHGRVVEQNRATLRDEIQRGAEALRTITGHPTKWFRPPRGMVTGDMLAAAATQGHEIVLWSVSRGGPAVETPAAVLAHLTNHLHPGAIIDLHDGTGINTTDAKLLQRRHVELEVLPSFLTRAVAEGYRFVTVSGLLAPTARDSALGVHR